MVHADGAQLFADRNRVVGGDHTRHPEFEIARWAAANIAPELRATATVYTSGEHCPMCAAAHAWVGMGRIVYAASSDQLSQWHSEWGVEPGPVATLPINAVAPPVEVHGPHPQFSEQIREHLIEALAHYRGALIVVSYDGDFVDRIGVTRGWRLAGDGFVDTAL